MANSRAFNPNMVVSAGTQVVSLKEVRGTNGAILHPRGAVGVIVKSPVDNDLLIRLRVDHLADTRRLEHV